MLSYPKYVVKREMMKNQLKDLRDLCNHYIRNLPKLANFKKAYLVILCIYSVEDIQFIKYRSTISKVLNLPVRISGLIHEC